jgi:hypothetical protein
MTTTQHADITIDHPGDLLASIPTLLGFHPVDSLVVFGLRGPRATELTLVLRAELPPPARAGDLARYLMFPLAQREAVGVALVVVGGQGSSPADDDLPHRALVAGCEAAFADAGMPVVHQLWTPDTQAGCGWRCYDESDCGGLLPDPGGTTVASLAAAAGLSVYSRREDIVETLAPEPPDVLARRSASLDRLSELAEPPPEQASDVVMSAIESARARPPVLSDDDVVTLARALSDHRIRDLCLDFDGMPDPAAAERLWAALTRATPPPERAEAASLLAFSAYARGDGVLAGIALDKAAAADPGHRLSGLLHGALTMGVEPARLREAGIRAARQAREALGQEAP